MKLHMPLEFDDACMQLAVRKTAAANPTMHAVLAAAEAARPSKEREDDVLSASTKAGSAAKKKATAAEARALLRGTFAFRQSHSLRAPSTPPSNVVSPTRSPLIPTPAYQMEAPSPLRTDLPPRLNLGADESLVLPSDDDADGAGAAPYMPTFDPPAGSNAPPLPVNENERMARLAESSEYFNWTLTPEGRDRAYQDLFNLFDNDSNNRLDAMEMCELLEALGFDTGSNVGQSQVLRTSSDRGRADGAEDVSLFALKERPIWFQRFVARSSVVHHADVAGQVSHGSYGSCGATPSGDRDRTFTFAQFVKAVRELDPHSHESTLASMPALVRRKSRAEMLFGQHSAQRRNRRRIARAHAEQLLHHKLKHSSDLNIERKFAVKHEVTRMRKYSDWFRNSANSEAGSAGVYFSLTVSLPKRFKKLMNMLQDIDPAGYAEVFTKAKLSWSSKRDLVFTVIVGDSSLVDTAHGKLRMTDTLAALKFQASIKIKPVLHMLRDSCEFVYSKYTKNFPKFFKSPQRRTSLAVRLTVSLDTTFDWAPARDASGKRQIVVTASSLESIMKGDEIIAVVLGDASTLGGSVLHESHAAISAALKSKVRPLAVTFRLRRPRIPSASSSSSSSSKSQNSAASQWKKWKRTLRSVPDAGGPLFDLWEVFDIRRGHFACSMTQMCSGDSNTLHSEHHSFKRLHLDSVRKEKHDWGEKVAASFRGNSDSERSSAALPSIPSVREMAEIDDRGSDAALWGLGDSRLQTDYDTEDDNIMGEGNTGDDTQEWIELEITPRDKHWCSYIGCGAGLAYRKRRQKSRLHITEHSAATHIERAFKAHMKLRTTKIDKFVVEETGNDIARIQNHFGTWLIYIIFLAFYLSMVAVQRSNGSLYVVEKGIHDFLKGTFIEKEHLDEKYDAVANSEDFWKWIRVFVEENYDDGSYQDSNTRDFCEIEANHASDKCTPRPGYMGTYNRLFGPAVVVVRRRKVIECNTQNDALKAIYPTCYGQVQQYSPFDILGTGTTGVNRDISLWGAENTAEDVLTYNGSSGIVHTWDPAWKGYPLYINLGSGNSTMEEEIAKLNEWEEGNFIDKQTWHIQFVFMTYNGNAYRELLSMARVQWDISTGGTYNDVPYEKVKVSSVQVEPTSATIAEVWSYFTGSEDSSEHIPSILGRGLLLVIIYVFVFFQIIEEISDLMEEGPGSYFTDTWNIIDFVGIVSIVLQCILASIIEWATRAAVLEIPGDPWIPSPAEALFTDGTPRGGTLEYTKFSSSYTRVMSVDDLTRAWEFLVAITLLLQILRMFKYLEWHPRVNLISATMQQAGPELLSWVIVFLIVVSLSGFLGHHLFGRYLVGFYTWENSIITVTRFIFGDFNYDDLVENRYHFGLVFFLLVQILLTVLLMNVMLAIVIGAFVEIQPETKKAGKLADDTLYILIQFCKRVINALTCVECCKGHTVIAQHGEITSEHTRCHQLIAWSGASKVFIACRKRDRRCAKSMKRKKVDHHFCFRYGFLCKPCCGGMPYLLREQAFQRIEDILKRKRSNNTGVPAAALSQVLSHLTDEYVFGQDVLHLSLSLSLPLSLSFFLCLLLCPSVSAV